MSTGREKELESIIAGFLKPAKDIPFEIVIRSLYDVGVEKFDQNATGNDVALAALEKAARKTCETVQQDPIRRPRPNEVGNDMEPFVISALKQEGVNASRPKTRDGGGKSAGYPDIYIERLGFLPIYLEVKTYSQANHNTTFRSFYLSPSHNPKVIDEAHHLLIGFEIVQDGNLFKPVAYEIVDLFGLHCDLKQEFNSDNKRLYEGSRKLAFGFVPHGNG